ncbi:MAG: hypothetical protein CVU16_11095 [Betaproteobacteria bacterium HGW-Betaproteobacteria-10]|nr:MAG: hypothetical protein CVU16_11095 [Betaproteobacteria bacterium HGW-Betaproteobacteria-10]
MTVIETAETNHQPVQLKFLLGELLLGSWWPQLVVADPQDFGTPGWPDPPETLQAVLPGTADGYLCRKVESTRFRLGIGRYGNFVRYIRYRDVLYYIELTGNFDSYLKKFSAKTRQNLSRSVRRFIERAPGKNGCETYTTPSDMLRFHAEASGISKETYQTLLLDSGLPGSPEFLKRMIALAEQGDARGYLLRDGKRAIAFAWCRRKGKTMVYDTIGYLPECANLSPGTVLLYLILENVFHEDECKIFDFGPGEAQYKSMFATHRQEFVDTYLFRSTLHNYLVTLLHYGLSNFSSSIGATLDGLGIKKHLRQLIRKIKAK